MSVSLNTCPKNRIRLPRRRSLNCNLVDSIINAFEGKAILKELFGKQRTFVELIMDRNVGNLLVCLLILTAVGLSCGKSDEEKRTAQAKKDRPVRFAAARLDLAKKPSKVELSPEPFLKGNVVMLGATDGREPGYQAVPALNGLEAMTPEEVGTVILTECRSTQRGVYRTSDNPPRELPAIAIDCEVSLIDRAAQKVYFSKMFQGNLSDETSVSQLSNSVASGPDQQINAFLAGLPRR